MVEVPSNVVHLRRLLHLIVPGGISLLDGIGNMKSLRTLQGFNLGKKSTDSIRDLGDLTNLRDLQFVVKEVREDDVGILAQLPSLTHLDLHIDETPKENVVICRTGFPALKHFIIGCNRIAYLTFEVGAMPMLQRLELHFNAKGWDKYGAAPVDIEHLSSLMEISVDIGGHGAKESDRRAAQSALRNAIDVHPGRPTANIECEHNSSYALEEEES